MKLGWWSSRGRNAACTPSRVDPRAPAGEQPAGQGSHHPAARGAGDSLRPRAATPPPEARAIQAAAR